MSITDADFGDLELRDDGPLGLSFWHKTAGQRTFFFTQKGELELLEFLQAKYPQGRESANVTKPGPAKQEEHANGN